MKKIAILASGKGYNASGLVTLFNEGNRIRVSLLLTDRENAPVIDAMAAQGVETMYIPREVWIDSPDEILRILREREIDMVVIDGFGSLVPREVIDDYSPFVLSVLPSLSPSDSVGKLDSLEVQRAVIEEGDTLAGCVVCRVDEPDGSGRIILKEECPAGNDPEALALRVDKLSRGLLPRCIAGLFREAERREHPENFVEAPKAESSELPPAPPSVDQRWAESLKVDYDPSRIVPPPVPGADLRSAEAPRQETRVGEERPPMPKSYLVWSVLATVLCCFIPGIIAIICSSQVASKYYSGDYEGAYRSSRNAEIWIIVSFVLGVLSSTLYLPFMLISDGFFG